MHDSMALLIGLGPIVAIAAGIALIWRAGTLSYGAPESTAIATALRVLGAVLAVAGFMLGTLFLANFLALLAIPVTGLALIVAVRRYYLAEQQSLLWVILSAAEHGIPLDAAARSFAEERNDLLGRRAAKLADYLEAGVPLSLALKRSGHTVNPEVALAADLGYQTGQLGPALRQAVDRGDYIESTLNPIASQAIYLGLLVMHLLFVCAFMLLKIWPIYQRTFFEFGLSLPQASESLIDATRTGTSEFVVWWTFAGFVVLFGAIGLMWLLGFPLRRLPGVRTVWRRLHVAWVLRWLALGMRQKRPMLETLRLVSGYFPDAFIRRRLERSAQRVEEGGHWCDGLVRHQLIRRRENAVLRAAERAGNLPWALDELADSALRSWRYRIQLAANVVFPLLLILFGGFVLATTLGFFTPLVSLIQALS